MSTLTSNMFLFLSNYLWRMEGWAVVCCLTIKISTDVINDSWFKVMYVWTKYYLIAQV